jgi:hypothetical protein
VVAGKGCGQRLRAKMKREICAMRAELHDKQKRVKYALLKQPFERCMTGYFCNVCKQDYILAMVMGLHQRLGQQSPVAVLTGELLHMIIEMTKPRRKLPAWLSCSWNLNFSKRRRASAVLECSRAAKRRREDEMDYGDSTSQPDSTGDAV